ncbi:MAG: zinc ribbon domain-containing protein [Myxococcota bacterium]
MKRAALWLALLGAMLPATSPDAQEPQAPALRDVAAGPAAIRGRIVHATRPEAARDLPVVLYALSASGEPGLRAGSSDERGEFLFENVSNAPGTEYLVGARFEDVPFGSRVAFAGGELEQSVELRVADVTADASGADVGETRIRIERGCGTLWVQESHELLNVTERVIYAPPGERQARAPIFRTRLPDDASDFEAPLGVAPLGLEQDGASVAFWGPLYPGGQALEFSYALPPGAGRQPLRWTLAAGARRLTVLTTEAWPAASGRVRSGDRTVALGAGPPRVLEGRSFRVAAAGRVEPGSALELVLEIPPPTASQQRVSVSEAELRLELDDASLAVDERLLLEVSGGEALTAEGDGPLLCLSLPAGAQDLRFSPELLELGLSPDPSGALAVRGPLPPGKSSLALHYRLPADVAPVRFERRFSRAVPLLTVFVADTGVLTEAERLHRRRPVRTEGRNYIHLEGFEIGAGETIRLELRPLPAHRGTSRWAATGFVLLAACAAGVFLMRPLRAAGPDRLDAEPRANSTAVERASVYAALQDAEHDFETGKLVPDDYTSLRAELRARAAALIREERQGGSAAAQRAAGERSPGQGGPPQAPPAQRAAEGRCASCGAPCPSDARFCSQCGTPLNPGPA